jgi:type IV secretion system protein VirB10
VSANTPNPPEDGGSYDAVPPDDIRSGGTDPLAGNPYSTQYRESDTPNLDSGAPELRTNDLRRMNRRALAFMAIIVALLLVLGLFLFKSATAKNKSPKVRDETISVPEAPKSFPQPLPRLPSPLPIPLVMPALPEEPLMRTPVVPQQAASRGPSLIERRMANGESVPDGGIGQQGPTSPAPGGLLGLQQGTAEIASNAQSLLNADALMLRGTFIRCVLETRIISDISGFTGRRLLLPKGSKVMGRYDSAPEGDREAVIWDRVVTPNGVDVNMASPGVDNLGGSGHPGHLNSHWGSRISSALLISLLSDAFKYEGAKHGPAGTNIGAGGVATQTPYESNTAQALQDLSSQAVRASANRKPTLTINQGTVVSIYVARDVDFSGVVARL